MTDKEIQLKLEEIVFEEIIAPNCATCSDAISGHPNKCDNGINCMSKLLNGEFINYKKIKDLDQNKALQTRIVELETALKLIKQGIKDRGDCRYWDDEDYAYKCKECDIPVNCPYNIASKALEEAEEAAK